jgi:hypothetical protein
MPVRKHRKAGRWAILACSVWAISPLWAAAQSPAQPPLLSELSLVPLPKPRAAATTNPSSAPAAGATTTSSSSAAGSPATAPSALAMPATQPADTEPYVPEEMKLPGHAGQPIDINNHGRSHDTYGDDHTLPIPDRWRIGVPPGYVQNRESAGIFDPYNQNLLKGDYPIFGDNWFLIVTGVSDTLVEARSVYTAAGVSSTDPGQRDFFGNTDQQFYNQNFILSFELFEGNTTYKPRDIEFKGTFVQNFNYVNVEQQGILQPDPGSGGSRFDEHFAIQELFVDKHLSNLSVNYDFWAIRAGIQQFNADFRGFLFTDNSPGVRLLGNFDNNKLIYNLAYFHQLEKDTNSGLNTFSGRGQDIFVANVFREDLFWKGYTGELSFVANFDYGDTQYNENDQLVRPQPIGTISEKEDKVFYLGWAGDGHIGWLNITHQFYQALGTESFNAIAGQGTNINAQFFATELSVDNDWQRYKMSFAYSSGDSNPTDNQATGFDAILDNPNFAGGGFSYFTRQSIPLLGAGTGLKGRNSLLPSLRTSKEQGQANFVNPGLLLYGIGADFDLTPRTKLFTNINYLQFADTSSLKLLEFDDKIGRDIGFDISVGMQYRPWNTQNIVFTLGAATLIPGQGFGDLFTKETLYSTFFSATFTY